MEEQPVARVRGEDEIVEGVPVREVGARQAVLFVLRTGWCNGEIRLEGFRGHLWTEQVHGEEVDVVVLGVKRTFRQGAEEQVFVHVRHDSLRDGVHFAVNGTQQVLGRTLVECLDARHLDGRTRVFFLANTVASTICTL